LKSRGQSILIVDKNFQAIKRLADAITSLKKVVRSGPVRAPKWKETPKKCTPMSVSDFPRSSLKAVDDLLLPDTGAAVYSGICGGS
jgi:hypothetical protein